MLSALVITLREGLEAALIVSILAAYLVKTGRSDEIRKIWTGVAAAAGLSLIVGLAVALGAASLSDAAREAFEGIASLAAVGVLTWMIFWMKRNARHIRSDLEGRAATASGLALALLAFTAVAREGLETVLFLYASFEQSATPAASGGGALAGLLIAVTLGYGFYKGGIKLNLRRFFQITGALIVVVAAGLVATGFHELEEAGLALPLTIAAWDTGGLIAKDGFLGSVLKGLIGYRPAPTVFEVIVYWAYLIPAMAAFFWPSRPAAPAPIRRAERESATSEDEPAAI